MDFLEILFIISIIELLITWVWFIILGFRANKIWGFSIIFLSPISPFMFASRFARKARQAIYYYVVSLAIFIMLLFYIQFFTLDFYTNFLKKIIPEPDPIVITVEEVDIKPPVTKPSEIDIEVIENSIPETVDTEDPVTDEAPVPEVPVIEKVEPEVKPVIKKPKKRSYKPVNLKDIQKYVYKKVIVYTSRKKHKGKLMSVTSSNLVIRKRVGGGKASMPIKRSKIIKVEVYL